MAFCYELNKKGINYKRQVTNPLVLDGIEFEEALRLDVLVEDQIICELKAMEQVNPVGEVQK